MILVRLVLCIYIVSFVMADSSMTPERAKSLIVEHLPLWRELEISEIAVEKIPTGLVNRLFIIKNLSMKLIEPRELIIRLFGGKGFDVSSLKRQSHDDEINLFRELGLRGFGPKLYGTFEGGMIVEFVRSRSLQKEDLKDGTIRSEIAKNVARYHSLKLDFPFFNISSNLYGRMEEFINKLDDDSRKQLNSENYISRLGQHNVDMILSFNWNQEIDWLRNQSIRIPSPEVFSLLDLNLSNCLIRDKPNENGERVMLIDYDISQMAPRGVDLGDHFQYYNGLENPESAKREFITQYLNEISRLGVHNWDSSDESVDHILLESDLYGMTAQFLVLTMVAAEFRELDIGQQEIDMLLTENMQRYQRRKTYFVSQYSERLV